MPQRLVISSRNAKKVGEIREILAPTGIEIVGIQNFSSVGEIEETGTTFAENAALKATIPARLTGEWVLGEDSGLLVDALHGAPGVYSARYSGPDATDERNNAKLLHELAAVPKEQRGAEYQCHIAVSDPTGTVRLRASGRCRGLIIDEARGANGFGYDPYFLIPEFHRTFGELSSTVKHALSHRARAFANLLPNLLSLLNDERPHSL